MIENLKSIGFLTCRQNITPKGVGIYFLKLWDVLNNILFYFHSENCLKETKPAMKIFYIFDLCLQIFFECNLEEK